MKCFQPIQITLKTAIWNDADKKFIESVPVPCGKCHACLNRRIAEWTFRLENERVNSKTCYFVTLTYDNFHVPINKYGKMYLEKNHVQKFLKKIRYDQKHDPYYGEFEESVFKCDLSKEKIKYYAVGEYGSKKKRPHYHLIMFNTAKDAIRNNWEKGDVDIQMPRNSQALGYCVKYLNKRIHNITPGNVTKEFSLMSKGIGENYILKLGSWHRKNPDILFTSNVTMTKIPMSKYYRNAIFNEDERKNQIPIIKNNIDETEKKERELYGANYEKKKDHQRKQFVKSINKRAGPRSDI